MEIKFYSIISTLSQLPPHLSLSFTLHEGDFKFSYNMWKFDFFHQIVNGQNDKYEKFII